MKKHKTFEEFWSTYGSCSLDERRRYFSSLSRKEQRDLVADFFSQKWHELFVKNIIDERLDLIQNLFDINVIDMRIKAIKHGQVFLINRETWENITSLLFEFEAYYDTNVLFGELDFDYWGRDKQFIKVAATTLNKRR